MSYTVWYLNDACDLEAERTCIYLADAYIICSRLMAQGRLAVVVDNCTHREVDLAAYNRARMAADSVRYLGGWNSGN